MPLYCICFLCARLVAQQLFVTWHHTRLAFIFYKYFSDLVFLELEKPYLSRPIYISHVWRYYINAPPTWHTNKGCDVVFTWRHRQITIVRQLWRSKIRRKIPKNHLYGV